MIDSAKFETKKELFEFLVTNKSTLIAQKKATLKRAESVPYIATANGVNKANTAFDTSDLTQFKVVAIINTTNVMDSHSDVHLKGIWSKSVKENKAIMHLQEHEMAFDKVISDGADLKVTTKEYDWSEMCVNATGKTQALVFESIVKRERNPEMFKQYSLGYVKNHSVGMNYVKLELAVNDKDYVAEKATWDKYISLVLNKEEAEVNGYFWAVKEAKVIEGSAVLIGSNRITPTLNNNKTEPSNDTQIKDNSDKPSNDTNLLHQLINNFK